MKRSNITKLLEKEAADNKIAIRRIEAKHILAKYTDLRKQKIAHKEAIRKIVEGRE